MTTREYAEGNNFRAECEEKFGTVVYEACMSCFDCLPISAIVENRLGRWLCCHGGLGPKLKSLEVVRSLDRRGEPPLSGAMCDLLWADPLLEDVLGYRLSDRDYVGFLELDFLPNPPRGCSYFYGHAALKPFLETNQLLGIVRAHQCKEEGVSYAYTDDRKIVFPFPYVTTVFSASNYCGSYGNKGAVMIFYPDDIQVLKFSNAGETWVEGVPYHPPDVTVPVRTAATEKAEPVSEEAGGEVGVVKAVIPAPPPLPPIMAPLPEVELQPEEEIEPEKGEVLLRRPRVPVRSQTVNYRSLAPLAPNDIRRKSLVNLKRGHTGEGGSYRFRAALRKDSVHELHPGWNSIRKLGRAVGRVQISRKASLEKGVADRTPSPEPSPDLSDSITKNLLSKIGENDMNQIRLVFDSIDKNRDGELSLAELEQFAADLCGSQESEGFSSEVKRLLQQMDEDKNGRVSFDEFTHYMAALSLLQTSQPAAAPDSAPSHAHPGRQAVLA